MQDSQAVFESLVQRAVFCSFPRRKDLTPDATNVLGCVLLSVSTEGDLGREGINHSYKRGWLNSEALDIGAENVVCVSLWGSRKVYHS